MVSVSAIILAGGQSSRMGQDKALLRIGNIPLLQQTCQTAMQCTHSVCIVTPWIDRYRDLFNADPLLASGCQLIQEVPLPGETAPHGPLVGFAQGLAHLSLVQPLPDWVLLLACDLPRLRVDVFQSWLNELPQASTDTIAQLPRNPQGWWEPMCGFYRPGCLPELEAYIQQGERSFQGWLSTQSVQELPLIDPQMLFNCNTPAEFRSLSE